MSLSKVVQVRVNTIMEVLSCLTVGMQWSQADYNLALKCLEKDLHPQPKTRGRKPAAKTTDEPETEPQAEPEAAPKAPAALKRQLHRHIPVPTKAPAETEVDVVQKRIDELPQLEVPVRGKKLYFQKSKVQYYRFEGDDEVFDRKTGDIAGTWDEVFCPFSSAPATAPAPVPAPATVPAPAHKPYHFQRNKIQYTRLENGDVADRKSKKIVGYWNTDLNNLVLDHNYSAGYTPGK